jgi:hypothetical protein
MELLGVEGPVESRLSPFGDRLKNHFGRTQWNS